MTDCMSSQNQTQELKERLNTLEADLSNARNLMALGYKVRACVCVCVVNILISPLSWL